MFDSIAIVGATGAVGQLIRNMLEERDFPYEKITFLASARSAGSTIKFKGKKHTVEELTPDAFEGIDLAIGSTPDEVAKDFVPWAVERGCVVVDESGYWRMDPKVPLVIPEVNPDARSEPPGHHRQPELLDHANGRRDEAAARRQPHPPRRRQHLPGHQRRRRRRPARPDRRQQGLARRQRAQVRNVRPPDRVQSHPADRLAQARRATPREEMKMVYETHKILGDDSIQVCPTCVRVPVSNCHSESILVETERKITRRRSPRAVRRRPRASRSSTTSPNGKYPMPSDCDGDDAVFIGRIREDLSSDNGLAFWCVSDNLRKGAATNAVQIAELLVRTQAAV